MPTEKQAAEMWCPYSRVLRVNGPTAGKPAFNRIHVAVDEFGCPPETCCIGSRCMAWRVQMDEPEPERHPGYKHARMVRAGPDQPCSDCEGSGTHHPRGGEPEPCGNCEGTGTVSNWQPVGFCGLAGKPE